MESDQRIVIGIEEVPALSLSSFMPLPVSTLAA